MKPPLNDKQRAALKLGGVKPITKETFMCRVTKMPSGCWHWNGKPDACGYGRAKIHNTDSRVHRIAYKFFVGEIPDGLWVLHTCDNPICVRPSHLWLGTNLENIKDRDRKGRQRNGITAKQKAKTK